MKFGTKNGNHFVYHYENTLPSNIVQFLPNGHSHIFGLHGLNNNISQGRINQFMKTIENIIFIEEFDNHVEAKMDQDFIWRPQVLFLTLLKITLNKVDSKKGKYYSHHEDH